MSNKKSDAGFSGILGEQTRVRNVNGQLIVKSRPRRRVGKLTEKQQERNKKFLIATQYAREQMAQPDSRAMYQARVTDKKPTGHVVALSDYLTSPEVRAIEARDYKGKVGNPITVEAWDDFIVTRVKIVISASDGNVIEEGNAEYIGAGLWNYVATVDNPAVRGTVIKAIAFDRPRHVGELEQVL